MTLPCMKVCFDCLEPANQMQYGGYGKGPKVRTKSLLKQWDNSISYLDILHQADLYYTNTVTIQEGHWPACTTYFKFPVYPHN